MKYIIFEDERTGLLQPVIFGEHTTHSRVEVERARPIGAGFFSFENGQPGVYGGSVSLNLESSEADLDLIIKMFLNMGTAFFIPFK